MNLKLDTSGFSNEAKAIIITMETDISDILNDIFIDYGDKKSNKTLKAGTDLMTFIDENMDWYLEKYDYLKSNGEWVLKLIKKRFKEVLAPMNVFDFAKGFEFGKKENDSEVPTETAFNNDLLCMTYLDFVMAPESYLLEDELLKQGLDKITKSLEERFGMKTNFDANFEELMKVLNYRRENDFAYSELKNYH